MNFISFLQTKYKKIFNAALFIITIAIIVLLLPKEGKFKYEYNKGKPWSYETLMAPFDFPIYKSQKQLKEERDSILENTNPYFAYDSSVAKTQIADFEEKYKKQQKEFTETFATENNAPRWQIRRIDNFLDQYKDYIVKLLQTIYDKGILVTDMNISLDEHSEIVVLTDNVAEELKVSQVYNQKEAYKYVVEKSESYVDTLYEQDNIQNSDLMAYINDYSLYQFVKPNLIYDDETTEKVRNSQLDDLSVTRGVVQAGERIVSKGEVVDSETYQIIESLRKEYEQKMGGTQRDSIIVVGHIIFVFAGIFVLYLFLYHFRNEILQNSLKSAFILFLIVLLAAISSLTIRLNADLVYLIPFAILAIIIRSFYDARLALFIHIITVLLVGFYAPNSFDFVFMNFIAGIVAIFSLTSLNRRGKLFLSSTLVILSYAFVYFGLAVTQEGNIQSINWMNFAYFGINGAIVLSSYPLIYVFEKTFGFVSDVTLMELSDTNQPLLRRLSERAPGTFQHSLQVANLAETAVYQIGGNTLLVRTGALYHDIGKMDNPIYFIENQSPDFNPHEQINSEESAKIIIGHVKKGVEIASKYKLPAPLVDFIRTHHGTTKVQYFYKKYIQNTGDAEIDDTQFTYSGPKPFSKEMAVLMMSDSVEAASRSYTHLNEKIINNLVDTIIDGQLNDGQFENVDITFRDITIIKGIFKKKLQNFYHARIKYPK
ncbi:MAG: HDIG domain-containing protein [Bacteroidales bacterium]